MNYDETEFKFCSEMTTRTSTSSGTKESNTNDQLNNQESNLIYEISETCLPDKEIHDHIINKDGGNLVTVGALLNSGAARPKI